MYDDVDFAEDKLREWGSGNFFEELNSVYHELYEIFL